jgi:hypothetical protein
VLVRRGDIFRKGKYRDNEDVRFIMISDETTKRKKGDLSTNKNY